MTMADDVHQPAPPPEGSGAPPESFLAHMGGHVMARIGLRGVDDGTDRRMALETSPVTLEAGGHVDFGVLGVFFDMASSGGFDPPRGGVHADIAITSLRPPSGPMTATARAARQGSRTGVVEVDLRDDTGALIATSTQEVVFRDPPVERPTERSEVMAAMRARFRAMFDGSVRLTEPLAEALGVERRGDRWHMAMAPDRTNGGGALHGGCAIALVSTAARDAATDALAGPARTLSAAVRYLAPARVGPFTAAAEVTGVTGPVATLRIRVTDDGQADRAVILADVHAVRTDA